MSLALEAAQALATTAHEGQMYGDQPYTKHLAEVVGVLQRFHIDDTDLLVAAWLHDVVEDTETTLESIELMFGRRVRTLVHCVTNEEGKNRKERHEKTYPKIVANDDAITLKLADRIANTEASIMQNDENKMKMYAKEYAAFRAMLHKKGTHDSMWRHLDFLMSGTDDPHERSGAW